MLVKDIPHVISTKHITPTSADLLALKRTGSTSKWSDHSAVEIKIRYTQTPKEKRMWSYPRHILVTDQEEVEKIRTDVSAALTRSNSTDPRACLIDWLKDTQNRTMEKEKKEKKEQK